MRIQRIVTGGETCACGGTGFLASAIALGHEDRQGEIEVTVRECPCVEYDVPRCAACGQSEAEHDNSQPHVFDTEEY